MQAANANIAPADTTDYVTVFVGETMFGLTIDRVHDVFVPAGITPVPLAPKEIVGLLNLRGRVVTALCLRRRLSLPDREAGAAQMAIGLEQTGETFALIVDGVGEVLKLGAETTSRCRSISIPAGATSRSASTVSTDACSSSSTSTRCSPSARPAATPRSREGRFDEDRSRSSTTRR